MNQELVLFLELESAVSCFKSSCICSCDHPQFSIKNGTLIETAFLLKDKLLKNLAGVFNIESFLTSLCNILKGLRDV